MTHQTVYTPDPEGEGNPPSNTLAQLNAGHVTDPMEFVGELVSSGPFTSSGETDLVGETAIEGDTSIEGLLALDIASGSVELKGLLAYVIELAAGVKGKIRVASDVDEAYTLCDDQGNVYLRIDTSIIGGKQTLVGSIGAISDLVGKSFRINGDDLSDDFTADRLNELLADGVTDDSLAPAASTAQTADATPTLITTMAVADPKKPTKFKVEVLARRDDGLDAASYKATYMARAVPSTEVLTVSGVPDDGSQVEIDGTTYTFLDTPAAAFDVQRDAGTAEANIDNLVAAINLTGTPGTEYEATTTVHPTFSARKDTAATMEIVAKTYGTAGNGASTTDPVDVGVVLSWGAVSTSGGSDMAALLADVTTEYESDASWTISAVAVAAGLELQVTGAADKTIDWTAWVQTFAS